MDLNRMGLIVSGWSHQRRHCVKYEYNEYSTTEANDRIDLLTTDKLVDLLFDNTAIASIVLLTRGKEWGLEYLISSSFTGGSNVVTLHFL